MGAYLIPLVLDDSTRLDLGDEELWLADFEFDSLPDLLFRQDGGGAKRVNGADGGEGGHAVEVLFERRGNEGGKGEMRRRRRVVGPGGRAREGLAREGVCRSPPIAECSTMSSRGSIAQGREEMRKQREGEPPLRRTNDDVSESTHGEIHFSLSLYCLDSTRSH